MSESSGLVKQATCLGCGCTCDDIELRVADGRIVEAGNACALGVAWFGDGHVPRRASRAGLTCTESEAVDSMAALLVRAQAPLVYLAPDITCETQRTAVAVADVLGATLDSVTSDTTLASLLASQQRGRAGATLGEIRNRADVVVFWGVDPADTYPRFQSRYAPDVAGVHVPEGRRSRTVIAIDVGEARGPQDADLRLEVAPGAEVATLVLLAAALGSPDDPRTRGVATPPPEASPADTNRDAILERIRSARYVAVIADAEPRTPPVDAQRAEALVLLSFALNAATRGALSLLRAGGNRVGADAVATWQTGFPLAIDFARGYPEYEPWNGTGARRLSRNAIDVVLIVGAAALIPGEVLSLMTGVPTCVIGPRASESRFSEGPAVIDTGVAGVHESGTVLRMDDVPLPVGAIFSGGKPAEMITRALCERIVALQREARLEDPRASESGAASTARREELFQRRTDG